MCTYDYRCNQCQTIFEENHGMSEAPIVKCPICDSTDTKKVILPINTIWKTSGATRNLTQSQQNGTDYLNAYRAKNGH